MKSLATSFLLINSVLGKEREVLNDLKNLKEVRETHLVYGVYDIVVRVETENMQELKDVVNLKIRKLDNVSSTLTMIVQ